MNAGTVLLGLINGLTIGLLAVGLVLIYKANRFINMAQAQMGTLSALLLEKWVLNMGWNFWAATAVAVVLGALTGVAVERVFIRTLSRRTRSSVSMLLMTIGVSQLLLGATFMPIFTPKAETIASQQFPQAFTSHVRLFGVFLPASSLLTLIVAPVLVAGLGAFLRYTSAGKQIRAVASNAESAALCGISVSRVQSLAWATAGGFAAIAALLAAPSQPSLVGSSLGPALLVTALGAAACGAFVSIPAALVGGLGLGLVSQVVAGITSNGGTAQLAVLLSILVIILVRGKAISAVFASSGPVNADKGPLRIPDSLRAHPLVRYRNRSFGLVALGFGLLMPFLPVFSSEGHRFLLTLVLVYALVGISLTMLTGWAGQVSLGHFALVGAGAYMVVHLAPHGWTIPAMVLFAGAVGAVIMVIVGLPALRVRGLTLAITTLAFGVAAQSWLFRQSWFGQESPSGSPLDPTPIAHGLGVADTGLSIYMTGIVLVVIAVLAGAALRRSTPGRLIVAVRDNERATAAFGISPATIKLAALALSGFVAASAGVLWALAWGIVSTEQFPPEVSVSIIAIPVLGGLGSLGGAVAGAMFLYLPAFFLADKLGAIFGAAGLGAGFLLVFGGATLCLTLLQQPAGIAGAVQDGLQALLDVVDRRRQNRPVVEPVAAAAPLKTHEVVLSFGGIKALTGASIEIRPGEIVGLIGPNGAGKTTLMNVISGVLQPDSGSVEVFGTEVVDLAADMRAALGVARSFQDATLFPGLTVRQTIQVALSYRRRIGFLSSMASAPWARATERASEQAADAVLKRMGLEPWADQLTSELSTGTRRICDLAAQVATEPKLLLLDEPTGGVAQREAEAFGPLLRRIRDELDCSVLIIEHDMPLLMGLCDRVFAMEAGSVIASGTPEQVRSDPRVVSSYLGTTDAAIDRSGGRRSSEPAAAEADKNATSTGTRRVNPAGAPKAARMKGTVA